MAIGAVLLALLVATAIGGMQAATPVAAQSRITQAPTIPGARDLTQAPVVYPPYPDAPRDAPNPLYLPTSPRSPFSLDRPDPLSIPTLPR